MDMKLIKRLALNILGKSGGDITFAKKIVRNKALISHRDNHMESFYNEVQVFQTLEVLDANNDID